MDLYCTSQVREQPLFKKRTDLRCFGEILLAFGKFVGIYRGGGTLQIAIKRPDSSQIACNMTEVEGLKRLKNSRNGHLPAGHVPIPSNRSQREAG